MRDVGILAVGKSLPFEVGIRVLVKDLEDAGGGPAPVRRKSRNAIRLQDAIAVDIDPHVLSREIGLYICVSDPSSPRILLLVKIRLPLICLPVPEKIPHFFPLGDFVDRIAVITAVDLDISYICRVEIPGAADRVDVSCQLVHPEFDIVFPEILVPVVLSVLIAGKPVHGDLFVEGHRIAARKLPGDAAGEHVVEIFALFDDLLVVRAYLGLSVSPLERCDVDFARFFLYGFLGGLSHDRKVDIVAFRLGYDLKSGLLKLDISVLGADHPALLELGERIDSCNEPVRVIGRLQFHFAVRAPEEAHVPFPVVLGLQNTVHAAVRLDLKADLGAGDHFHLSVAERDLEFVPVRFLGEDLLDFRGSHIADILPVDVGILEEMGLGVSVSVVITPPYDQKEQEDQEPWPASASFRRFVLVIFIVRIR